MDIDLSGVTSDDNPPKEPAKKESDPKQVLQTLLQRQAKFLESCREIKVSSRSFCPDPVLTEYICLLEPRVKYIRLILTCLLSYCLFILVKNVASLDVIFVCTFGYQFFLTQTESFKCMACISISVEDLLDSGVILQPLHVCKVFFMLIMKLNASLLND